MCRLQKLYIMPNVRQNVFVEKDFEGWTFKIYVPCNYLQSFYVSALVDECGTNKHYPLSMFRNGILKRYDYLIKAQ